MQILDEKRRRFQGAGFSSFRSKKMQFLKFVSIVAEG